MTLPEQFWWYVVGQNPNPGWRGVKGNECKQLFVRNFAAKRSREQDGNWEGNTIKESFYFV